MALTSFELRSRADKFLKEQQERIDKDRRRKEKEALLLERQRQREAEREEEARRKRVQEQLEAEQAAERRAAETEWNRGVYLSATLQAAEADEAAAAAKGIRRSKDKVLLPPSMGASLMAQDAAKNGTMLFHLRARATGHETHAGVLEFTAPEGVVLLPAKVRQCLFGNGGAASGLVDVTYKRLDKGTFVRFQPLTRGFHEGVGEDVRAVLEAALHQYCCLSVGDTLPVEHAGTQYTLRVAELQPGEAVSVIDTDVEAEVVASVETEQAIKAWEEEQRRNAELAAAARAELEAKAAAVKAAAEAAAQAQREAEAAAREAAEKAAAARAAAQAAKLAALPAEPPADDSAGVVACAFRLPDGTRLTRRFLLAAPVQGLFDFVDAHGAGGCTSDYHLVTQFPRRTLSRPTPLAAQQGSSARGDQGLGEQQEAMEVDGGPIGGAVEGAGAGSPQHQQQQQQQAGEVTLQALGLGRGGQELFLLEPLEPLHG